MLMVDLLRRGGLQSQEQLVVALAHAGEPVTQATVSRDLAAIGAVRGPDGYRLPEVLGDPVRAGGDGADEVQGMVRRHAVSVVAASSVVVIKTAPGHAQMVATAFDRWPPEGVAGTVAGDDTIFLAAMSPDTAQRVAVELSEAMFGGTA